MKGRTRGKKTASIVLGIISLGLLFACGQFALILLAFAPSSAWMPLLPSVFLSLLGLFIGIYAETRIGTIINSIIIFAIAIFLVFMFIRISNFVPQTF